MKLLPTQATTQFDQLLSRTNLCSICATSRSPYLVRPSRKRPRTERYASSLSNTAVNGNRPIPEQYRPLHSALSEVNVKASAHVNASRLQLALQGLESETPVVRVALLGQNIQDTARRLTRLLLVDVLEDELHWEKQILSYPGTQGMLIRYGQPQSTSLPQRSSLPILYIPSPILQKLNVEILISSVNSEVTNGDPVPVEAFLAPATGVPTAFDGRSVTVNQPVHRAVVIAQGFNELVKLIELIGATQFDSDQDRDAVTIVANLPNLGPQVDGNILVCDLEKAEHGLNAFRTSTSQALTYGREWNSSGLPYLSEWLNSASANQSNETSIPKPVADLIASILTTAESSLRTSLSFEENEARLRSFDPSSRLRIDTAIDDFSRSAHRELQSGLASAWSSRNWRKLSWYKLFWRVDDVGLIISDLVTNTWLPKTERATYEISGRLTQLGINPVMAETDTTEVEHKTAFEPETAQATILDPVAPVLAAATTSPANEMVLQQPSEPVLKTSALTNKPTVEIQPPSLPIPVASSISTARSAYLRNQITSLTSIAQQLVLRTYSISGFSAGLSALTYVSAIAPTVYEAGTIFAVGTVFAMYRLQTGWQQATKAMEKGLFEEGRDVIRRTVQRLKDLVEQKVISSDVRDPVEARMFEDASQAVAKAKQALVDLEAKGQDTVSKH